MKAFLRSGLFAILVIAFSLSAGAANDPKVSATPAAKPVPDSAELIQPVKVGETVPDVTLTNADGMTFKLMKLVKHQPTILIFYRGGWCVYCNTQLGQLKQIEVPLQKLGYQILAVSPDKVEKIRESLQKYDLSYMLVSDSDAEAIKAFGLAFRVDDATFNKMKKDFGIDLEEHSGKSHHLLPVPAAFVLDKKGKILYSYVNPDYRVRVDSQALLSAAEQAVRSKGSAAK